MSNSVLLSHEYLFTVSAELFTEKDFTPMLPMSMFISRQSDRILENKNEVLVACRQVPDPQVQVQVQVFRSQVQIQVQVL